MQCGVCVCGPSRNARGGQWGREALVPIPQFLSIVVTHASTRGAFLPLCHVLPPMSKRLVGRIFISSDIVNRTPLIGAFKRLQENANRSTSAPSDFESEKALDRTAELALRDGHCAFAGKSA